MAYPTIDRGRQFNLIWLVNGTGIIFQWNVIDLQEPDTLLYSFEFRWRQWTPRLWWTFAYTQWNGNGKLRYSHGRKYKQRSGWTINGPLIKFTVDHI